MRRKLSQIFLRNENIAKLIASKAYEKTLEIGAGRGIITKYLVNNPRVKELYVVEIDKNLCEKLKEFVENVICEDFLKLKPFPVDSVVSNVPFHISSDLLFRLKEWDFKEAFLIFQKEFAERLYAKPGESNYGRLSVTAQAYFTISPIFNIPRGAFYPIPKVDASLVKVKKKQCKYPEYFEDLVRLLFSQKNKKVKNILDNNWKIPEELSEKRPRHLSTEEILRIKPKL